MAGAAIKTAWAILDISPRSEDRRCSTDLPRHERQTSDSADRRAEGYMPSAGNIQDHPSRLNNAAQACGASGQNRTLGRASPPPSAIAVPSARQQAAPVMAPSSAKPMQDMPPAT